MLDSIWYVLKTLFHFRTWYFSCFYVFYQSYLGLNRLKSLGKVLCSVIFAQYAPSELWELLVPFERTRTHCSRVCFAYSQMRLIPAQVIFCVRYLISWILVLLCIVAVIVLELWVCIADILYIISPFETKLWVLTSCEDNCFGVVVIYVLQGYKYISRFRIVSKIFALCMLV